ncbi:MAG TPA: AAA family ATPase [Streptosporangiaceae bacterium]|nr:AAA family ATPase [Streptosporangiaceae bacterium]
MLVTLVLTMMGQFSLRNFKISMLLLAITLGLAAAWSYLPHVWFIVVVICAAGTVLAGIASRNTFRQTRLADPPPPRPQARAGPPPRAQVRGRRFRTADAGSQLLPPDARVTLADERAAAGVDDVFASLDRDLVGLLPVKQKVEEIASLLLVDRVRQRFGLSAPRPNLHMCFTGEPGTGKTTVALKMADLLHRLGYLEQGHLVHAMRDDLVGEFIGHTAPKTKRVLERAMGGVLFIDEAYYLYRASDSKDYGQECIEILLQVMENDRDKLVVILAGYKDRMDEFFECNPGLSSRIAHHLDFAPYQVDELVAIGRGMLDQSSYYLSDDAEAAFRQYLTIRMQQPRFANARSVRNELERARLRHAHRLAADPAASWSRDDLMRLEPLDVLTSPVFSLSAIDE